MAARRYEEFLGTNKKMSLRDFFSKTYCCCKNHIHHSKVDLQGCNDHTMAVLEHERRARQAQIQAALQQEQIASVERQAIREERLENKRIESRIQILMYLKDMKLDLGTDQGVAVLRDLLIEPEREVPSQPHYDIDTTDSDEV